MKSQIIKKFLPLILILLIFAIDRISKDLVVNYFMETNNQTLYLNSFINFILIRNEGIAFGLFSLSSNLTYNLITIIIVSLIIYIFFLLYKSEGVKRYTLCMIIGGAFGNLFDRIKSKSVPDFIDLHINDFHWFVFNIADIFITIGIIILIYLEIFKKMKTKSNSTLKFLFVFLFLASCGSNASDIFTTKKNNAEQFLIEKNLL